MRGTQTTISFSAKRDPDLLELYKQVGRKHFVLILKEAMRMLIRPGYKGTVLSSTAPFPGKYEGGDMNLTFTFSAEKDRDIAEMLRSVGERKSGIFVKNAMRMALGPYFCLGCLLEGDNRLNEDYKDKKLFFVQVSEGKAEKAKKKTSAQKTKNLAKKKEKSFSWDDVFEESKEESSLTGAEEENVVCTTKEEPLQKKDENLDNQTTKAEPVADKTVPASSALRDEKEPGTGKSEGFSEDDVLSLLENM